MVYFVLRDLDIYFQGQTFLIMHFFTKKVQAADVPGRFASTRATIAVELLLLEKLGDRLIAVYNVYDLVWSLSVAPCI